MTCVYDSAFIELKNTYDKINVVDVGAARPRREAGRRGSARSPAQRAGRVP